MDEIRTQLAQWGFEALLAILTAIVGAFSLYVKRTVVPMLRSWLSVHFGAETERLIETYARRAAYSIEETARAEGWEGTGSAKLDRAYNMVYRWLAEQGYNLDSVGDEQKIRQAIRAAVFDGWNKYKLLTADSLNGVTAKLDPPVQFGTEQCLHKNGCVSADYCLQAERCLHPGTLEESTAVLTTDAPTPAAVPQAPSDIVARMAAVLGMDAGDLNALITRATVDAGGK